MAANLLKMAHLDWAVPDYTILCRRQKMLAAQILSPWRWPLEPAPGQHRDQVSRRWCSATQTRAQAVRFCHNGADQEIASDVVLLHHGVVANAQASLSFGLVHDWHQRQRAFCPRVDGWGRCSLPNIFVAGDGAGIYGAKAAALSGDICRIAALGCLGPNQTKTFVRAGTGPCQGRFCELTLTELLAAHHGLPQAQVGALRIRPPLKLVTLAEIAALDEGPLINLPH